MRPVARESLTVFVLSLVLLFSGARVPVRTTPAQGTGSLVSREPILRIETPDHTTRINELAVDSTGRILVTVSDDKTARVWSLTDATLVRVLRVPIGDANAGKLYSVAISPDDRTVAVSGWTSVSGLSESIYLFDLQTGRMQRQIGGLQNPVFGLAYSKDGSRLAAAVGRAGVLAWRTSDWTEVGRDADYTGPVTSVAFDGLGRLITGAFDGFIRVYSPEMRLAAKQPSPGGKVPRWIAIAPDNRRIAVGLEDTQAVSVIDASTLQLLYTPDTSGINGLADVMWSRDGTFLYMSAYTTRPAATDYFVRRWDGGGRGRPTDARIGQTTIGALGLLPSGALVFVSARPAWGVIDTNMVGTPLRTAANTNFLSKGVGLRTNATATAISVPDLDGLFPGVFDLTTRSWRAEPGAGAADGLHDPTVSRPGVTATWHETFEPSVNGVRVNLIMREMSRTIAFTPDGAGFLLGADYSLALFNMAGKPIWSVSVPGTFHVNMSSDGKLAVAAHGDGTIRWYRITDGKELMAFFPYSDTSGVQRQQQWVLWTPSGYYDASPGAEQLIGWHVNNGIDRAPDFFPIGQFRNAYYRPDIMTRVLALGDEARAVALANAGRSEPAINVLQQRPPVVEIVSPATGYTATTPAIAVRFLVRTPSGEPVTAIRALVDGRPAEAVLEPQTPNATADAPRSIRVTIPERDVDISIIAANQYASSVPASVRVAWKGQARGLAATPGATTFVVKPRLYILAIGVSQYANPKFNLQFAAKDARDFVTTMQAQKDGIYRDIVVYRNGALTDAAATKDEILDGLDWIRRETTSNDVAMVFLAGHGVNDQNNFYFFWPHQVDPERLLRTGLAFTDIRNAVSSIAGKALFFVDSCHSGNSLGTATRRNAMDINIVINELASAQNGVVVFSASTGSESAYEQSDWNNGAFTKALVEGLGGAAAMGSNRITYGMLNVYVSERVKALTGGRQHPTMSSPKTIDDFPIAIKR